MPTEINFFSFSVFRFLMDHLSFIKVYIVYF